MGCFTFIYALHLSLIKGRNEVFIIMDLSSRNLRPAPRPATQEVQSVESKTTNNRSRNYSKSPKLRMIACAIVCLVVLFGVYSVFFASNQKNLISTSKYQAVFLNDGQVYFGHIKHLDSQYIDLKDIYYVTSNSNSSTSSSTSSNNIQLVKLGCELHSPYDEMVFNMSQVIFWENIQDSGKVVTAINSFKHANPKGQNCSNLPQSTQQAPATTPAKQ